MIKLFAFMIAAMCSISITGDVMNVHCESGNDYVYSHNDEGCGNRYCDLEGDHCIWVMKMSDGEIQIIEEESEERK
jgi:hypothetical protein